MDSTSTPSAYKLSECYVGSLRIRSEVGEDTGLNPATRKGCGVGTRRIRSYMSNFYKSKGILEYSENWRLVVRVEQDLADYYRSLIPKWMDVQRPRWPAHITVVRQEFETPVHKNHWWKYNNKPIDFLYEPKIHQGELYYWLNVYCVELENIREELGLPYRSRYTQPPKGFKKFFHCTIANKK